MAEPFSIEINQQELSALMARLSPEQVDKRAHDAMEESVGYLQAEVQKNLPRGATGILRGTIFTEVRGRSLDKLRGVVASPHAYAVVIEKGRTPGKRMPPVDAILLWTTRKLGIRDRGVAFVIARSIGRKGFPGKHVFENVSKNGFGTVQNIWKKHFSRL